MQVLKLLWAVALFPSLAPFPALARTFSAADGRKLDGEIVEANEKTVTIRRTLDGRAFILPINTLSGPDQDEIGKWNRLKAASKVVISASKDKVPPMAPVVKSKGGQEETVNKSAMESEMWRWTVTLKNTTQFPVEGLKIKYNQIVERKDRNQGPKVVMRRGEGTLSVPSIPPYGKVTVQTDEIEVQACQSRIITDRYTYKGEEYLKVKSIKWDESLSGLGVHLSLNSEGVKYWKTGNDPASKPPAPAK